ncbi:MAG: hypothetical protein M1816_008191 [Peltula sp. TS41687]|nr:MAG: hypothetical protein M1816_008191 [Peltula sp. TS41687]
MSSPWSSPDRTPVAGNGLAKKLEDLATPVKDAVTSVIPPPNEDYPAIPLSIIDAPSQRAYALAIYAALFAWRIYDYTILIKDDADSLFYFMKWATIDGLYIYGLPALRIPWLEWSGTTSLILFAIHAVLDWMLMFRVGVMQDTSNGRSTEHTDLSQIPINTWFFGLTKLLYDREIAISERKVKPADILRDAELILGKQTIHILPEGSAMLNPNYESYCIDHKRDTVTIPIRINQTNPVLIELTRIDLETHEHQTISIADKQARALKKQADRRLPKHDVTSPRDLDFRTHKTGLYRLHLVRDESGLLVQKQFSDALVVPCPKASFKPASQHKCKGELSNLLMEVVGMPPLTVKYSRIVNREDRSFSFQSIQPENLQTPLEGQQQAMILSADHTVDLTWARPHRIEVPLNESLNTLGSWIYTIEAVQDARGNTANYSLQTVESDRAVATSHPLEHVFTIHQRPKASLETDQSTCDIRVARGRSAALPVKIEASGRGDIEMPCTVMYRYTSAERLKPSGEHASNATFATFKVATPGDQPKISRPGLYTLESVSTPYCAGDVLEPTSCMLINPPEPDISITAENIYDSCAGSSIGLRVDLDLIGTPPFEVTYDEIGPSHKVKLAQTVTIDGLRRQLEFRPSESGHYIYHFKSIKDSVYDLRRLPDRGLSVEQDVKPPASAQFAGSNYPTMACIDQRVSLIVNLQGEQPWGLEYEVINGDKRIKHKITDIQDRTYTIWTDPLIDGGEHTVALVSVHDRSGCKVFLSQEAKVNVRQKPKAAFGLLDGKYTIMVPELTKVALPLRLSGHSPWIVRYKNHDDPSAPSMEKALGNENDVLEVDRQGTYQLLTVRDASCPGTVEEMASEFEIQWIARPKISVPTSSVLEKVGYKKYAKAEVCEGNEDVTELTVTGTPPYTIMYQQKLVPNHGSKSISNKEFKVGLGVASIRMETSQAGLVTYTFSRIGDHLYDDVALELGPLVISQRVNQKPSASFTVPGKTYRYCKEEEEGEETIPLALQGTPPFYLELAIKHHSKSEPEIIPIANIDTKKYEFRIPHRVLDLGSHSVSIRKIRDAKGCQRKTEAGAAHVLVKVADAPSISPIEDKMDYCVGDRISYTLSGVPPFNVYYTFRGKEQRAVSANTDFRRIAESAGTFEITGISDHASNCRSKRRITKVIHDMPRVRISKGKETSIDIPEGGKANINFEFTGTPPFEFTYTRSELPSSSNKKHNQVSGGHRHARILETKTDVSEGRVKIIEASLEGTYEAVAIKDRYCGFAKRGGPQDRTGSGRGRAQKLIGL